VVCGFSCCLVDSLMVASASFASLAGSVCGGDAARSGAAPPLLLPPTPSRERRTGERERDRELERDFERERERWEWRCE
jgi:hypothetical protein